MFLHIVYTERIANDIFKTKSQYYLKEICTSLSRENKYFCFILS